MKKNNTMKQTNKKKSITLANDFSFPLFQGGEKRKQGKFIKKKE